MKISTNFVRPVQLAVMPIVVALWLAALGLAGGAWWLLTETAELRGELPQLRQRFERITTGADTAAAQRRMPTAHESMPSAQELAETRERVAKINAAAQTKGLPTSALLNELETQLPPEVWLTSFHHRASEGEVLLVASASSADALSAFLLKLERDSLFDQVMLMREFHPTGTGQPGVQFEIRLKVRS